MTVVQMHGVTMIVVGSILFILGLIMLWVTVGDYLTSTERHEAQVRRHRAKRLLDLERHRFEVRRDAARVRREIRDELIGRRR